MLGILADAVSLNRFGFGRAPRHGDETVFPDDDIRSGFGRKGPETQPSDHLGAMYGAFRFTLQESQPMEREQLGTDAAEVWQAAQYRRAADISALFGKRRQKTGRSIMPTRRRLAIPTVFASLAMAAAVWTVAGAPMHHKHAKQTDRPAFEQTKSSPAAR
jgi:hypothetical protein